MPMQVDYRDRFVKNIMDKLNELRGSNVIGGPFEVHIAQRWQEQGIPLKVVLEALQDCFQRHIKQEQPKGMFSLSKCRWSVENAYRTFLRSQLGKPLLPPLLLPPSELPKTSSSDASEQNNFVKQQFQEIISQVQNLDRYCLRCSRNFADQLWLKQWSEEIHNSLQDLLNTVRESKISEEEVHERLKEIDQKATKKVWNSLEQEQKNKILQAVDQKLKNYKDRMRPEVWEKKKISAILQEVRREFVLPDLNLYRGAN